MDVLIWPCFKADLLEEEHGGDNPVWALVLYGAMSREIRQVGLSFPSLVAWTLGCPQIMLLDKNGVFQVTKGCLAGILLV